MLLSNGVVTMTEQLLLVENKQPVKPQIVKWLQVPERASKNDQRHCARSRPTTAPDGGQQPTNHTLGWGGISDPGQHLYGNQGGEVRQH